MFWMVYFMVLVMKLYWMIMFETMTMLVNLATKLTVIAGLFLIDTHMPVMIKVTA